MVHKRLTMPLCPGSPSRARDLCSTKTFQGRAGSVQLCPVAYSHGFLWNLTKSDSLLLKSQVLKSYGSLFFFPFKDASVFFSLAFVGNCLQMRTKHSWTEEEKIKDSLFFCTLWWLHCILTNLIASWERRWTHILQKPDDSSTAPALWLSGGWKQLWVRAHTAMDNLCSPPSTSSREMLKCKKKALEGWASWERVEVESVLS